MLPIIPFASDDGADDRGENSMPGIPTSGYKAKIVPLQQKIAALQAQTAPVHSIAAGFHTAASVSQLSKIAVFGQNAGSEYQPWLANGVVYQLPQSLILGLMTFESAKQYMIGVFGYAYYSQLWKGYWPAGETPEFTVNDVFTVVTRLNNKPTMFAWFSVNALPYADFIMKANFGFQTTSRSGPIIPALQLSRFAVNSSMGQMSVPLQYVQYVPDTRQDSGNHGWVFQV